LEQTCARLCIRPKKKRSAEAERFFVFSNHWKTGTAGFQGLEI
jgi:hypothetical protein